MTTALIDADRKNRKGRNKHTADSFVTDTHKKCSWCDGIKLHSEFSKDKKNIHGKGLGYYCKECASAKTRAHHAKYKESEDYQERKKTSYYKRNYGMSLDDRAKMLEQQNNSCKICKIPLKNLGGHTHTDHDHVTEKVRGILCTNCNRGLGHFQDNTGLLMEAIKYLQSHTENGTQKEGSCL